VKDFYGKLLCTEENQIYGLCREWEAHHSSSFEATSTRLDYSRDSPQGPIESESNAELTHARMLQLQQLGLGATVTTPKTTWMSLKDSKKQANPKFGWIQCEKESQVWSITKPGLSSICLLEEKQYKEAGYKRLIRMERKLSTTLSVAWWQI